MNQIIPPFQHEDEEEEVYRLSFCDLPISAAPHKPSASPDHLFEFSGGGGAAAANFYYNDIVFCGKIINEGEGDRVFKSQSLRKPKTREVENRRFSVSTRFAGSLDRPKCSNRTEPVYHAGRVNITSLTSMSAKSRRRMFMFGPVKFKPEMELSAIKERQKKMVSAAVVPPTPQGGGKGQWGFLKSSLRMRGRSHLTSVLARSLGCIPVAAGGGASLDRQLGVAS